MKQLKRLVAQEGTQSKYTYFTLQDLNSKRNTAVFQDLARRTAASAPVTEPGR